MFVPCIVFDAVNDHEDSWPFSESVDEAYAPAYYQIIIKPMCLTMIQKKINKRDYKTKYEVCHQYALFLHRHVHVALKYHFNKLTFYLENVPLIPELTYHDRSV